MVRKKLTRSEVARMGGVARADRLSAQERSAIATKGGNAVVEKYGRVQMLRLAYQKAGRLPATNSAKAPRRRKPTERE